MKTRRRECTSVANKVERLLENPVLVTLVKKMKPSELGKGAKKWEEKYFTNQLTPHPPRFFSGETKMPSCFVGNFNTIFGHLFTLFKTLKRGVGKRPYFSLFLCTIPSVKFSPTFFCNYNDDIVSVFFRFQKYCLSVTSKCYSLGTYL